MRPCNSMMLTTLLEFAGSRAERKVARMWLCRGFVAPHIQEVWTWAALYSCFNCGREGFGFRWPGDT